MIFLFFSDKSDDQNQKKNQLEITFRINYKSTEIYILSTRSKMASSCPSLKKRTECSEIILPKEIWIHILSFLDFDTLQVLNHSLFRFLIYNGKIRRRPQTTDLDFKKTIMSFCISQQALVCFILSGF